MSPEESKNSFVQSWIRDWDALGGIRDPGFAATAEGYIEWYKEMPEASAWVAKAEGLLAELTEFGQHAVRGLSQDPA